MLFTPLEQTSEKPSLNHHLKEIKMSSCTLPVDEAFQFPGINVSRIVMMNGRVRTPTFHELNSVQRPISHVVVTTFSFRRRRQRRWLVTPDASGSSQKPFLTSWDKTIKLFLQWLSYTKILMKAEQSQHLDNLWLVQTSCKSAATSPLQ